MMANHSFSQEIERLKTQTESLNLSPPLNTFIAFGVSWALIDNTIPPDVKGGILPLLLFVYSREMGAKLKDRIQEKTNFFLDINDDNDLSKSIKEIAGFLKMETKDVIIIICSDKVLTSPSVATLDKNHYILIPESFVVFMQKDEVSGKCILAHEMAHIYFNDSDSWFSVNAIYRFSSLLVACSIALGFEYTTRLVMFTHELAMGVPIRSLVHAFDDASPVIKLYSFIIFDIYDSGLTYEPFLQFISFGPNLLWLIGAWFVLKIKDRRKKCEARADICASILYGKENMIRTLSLFHDKNTNIRKWHHLLNVHPTIEERVNQVVKFTQI